MLSVKASFAAPGAQPGGFLRQDPSARAGALSGALTAVVDDSSALSINPAGLALGIKPELGISRVQLFEDTSLSHFGGMLPVKKWGAFGGSLTRQSTGGFERRATPIDSASSFSISQTAIAGGWAIALPLWRSRLWSQPKPLLFGFAVKGVDETLDTVSNSAIGVDAGLIFHPVENLYFGAAVQNALSPKIKFASESLSYARTIDASPAYLWRFASSWKALFMARVSKTAGEKLGYSGGVELTYRKFAFLRLGGHREGYSAGLGYRRGNTQADYSIATHVLGMTHFFTITNRFGLTREELEETIRQGISKLSRGEAVRLSKAYLQRAEVDLREERVAEALRGYEAASLWDPANKEIPQKIKDLTERLDRSVARQTLERTEILAAQSQQRGNLLASRQYWQAVLELKPEHPQAKAAIAQIDASLTDEQRAKVRRPARKDPVALLGEAERLLSKGALREARLKAQEASRAGETPEIRRFLDRADAALRASIERRLKQAQELAAGKDRGAAIPLLQSVVRDDPKNAAAEELLSTLRGTLSQQIPAEARKRAEQLYYRAVEHYLKGNYDAAEPMVAEILKLDPSSESAAKLSEKLEAARSLLK